MKVIEAGHHYQLDSMEGRATQSLMFINKQKVGEELRTIYDGTTNEEVLRMLIDRMNWLNGICSCRENSIAIAKLEEALMWLEKRTADRMARKVEGTPLR